MAFYQNFNSNKIKAFKELHGKALYLGGDPENGTDGTLVTASGDELNILDGVTADATELNLLDGVTASTAELNILDTVTATASELNILDGVTAVAADLNLAADTIADITFAAASAAANICEVTLTPKDASAASLTGIRTLEVWLSDASTGAGLTGTSASGTVAVKAASGTDLSVLTSKKHLIAQSVSGGTYILEITDTAKTAFFVCAKIPGTGKIAVSTVLATGDYGS